MHRWYCNIFLIHDFLNYFQPSEDWQQDEMKVKNEIIGDDDNDDEIPEESDGNYSEEKCDNNEMQLTNCEKYNW